MFTTKEQVHNMFDQMFATEPCKHTTKIFQPAENETNVPESYSCNDCGEEFDVPEDDDSTL